MSTQSKTRPIRVAPKGWTPERADRVLAVEGLRVSGRSKAAMSGDDSIAAKRRKVIAAINT
ncbi:MAG TPA: hypothetical protein VNS12_00435 [Pelagibacterium sp.]|uniref:hypothetical protein n=1 Tax=Pelagibacterium sp. TaxID=1967288 RepID=UPI002BDE3937|nr:hypothetical protein [Pelagibacterium sp.]HWJ86521.1 hypothetical protein [Pelagibacterium sp.]